MAFWPKMLIFRAAGTPPAKPSMARVREECTRLPNLNFLRLEGRRPLLKNEGVISTRIFLGVISLCHP